MLPLRELDDSALPEFDVTLRVEYSSLNYKDALADTNRGLVVRNWQMVPGIDGAGVVEQSRHPEFTPGDRVILNGWRAGEQHWGCLAERARLKGECSCRCPNGWMRAPPWPSSVSIEESNGEADEGCRSDAVRVQ